MSPNRLAEAQSIEKAGDIDERHEQVNRSGYSGDCFDCVTRPEQCAPVGDGHRFSTSSQAKSPRRKAESPTLPLPDTERIRHQTECSWNQTQTGRGATVSEAGNSGDEAEQCRSRCGVVGRSVGGAKHAVPVFYPGNGDPQQKQPPEKPERFSFAWSSGSEGAVTRKGGDASSNVKLRPLALKSAGGERIGLRHGCDGVF